MHNLYIVRPVRSIPQPSEQRSAKVIGLRVRREARRAEWQALHAARPYAF